jgi:Ribbon-helix-helix protein, copG family
VRTTVDLDDDLLAGLRSLARAQGRSVSFVLSDLVRRALRPTPRLQEGAGGFPTFEPPAGAAPLTVEAVRAALDDET